MENSERPRIDLAQQVLPESLLEALEFIFAQEIPGLMLAGGTAIAGFYAGHRRSDDLDLFVANSEAYQATVRATKSLQQLGTALLDEFQSQLYYKATCELKSHRFTVDVVLDEQVFQVGRSFAANKQILVADLPTLFMMKATTLVSRCSEKDLYDLIWLFEHAGVKSYEELISLGKQIDGGMNGEALLYSLSSAQLLKEACDFAIDRSKTATEIYQEISAFRKELVLQLSKFLHSDKSDELGLRGVIRRIRKLDKRL